MKKILFLTALCFCLLPFSVSAGFFDDLFKGVSGKTEPQSQGLSESTIVSGLKEALSVSTEKAVSAVSRENGYFNNPAIKILIPEKLRKATDILKKFGFDQTVNDFELSMNRAVERAAPQAKSIFMEAIRGMSFEDAKGILNGGDTSATDYFSTKTSEKLYGTFKPIISDSMDQMDVTKRYKEMEKKYTAVVPLGGSLNAFELNDYVTRKGLEGLFFMMAEEEKKIRNNPVERTTELLKTVFGK